MRHSETKAGLKVDSHLQVSQWTISLITGLHALVSWLQWVIMRYFFADSAPSGFISQSRVLTTYKTLSWFAMTSPPSLQSHGSVGVLCKDTFTTCQWGQKRDVLMSMSISELGVKSREKKGKKYVFTFGHASCNGVVFSAWPPSKEVDRLWISA